MTLNLRIQLIVIAATALGISPLLYVSNFPVTSKLVICTFSLVIASVVAHFSSRSLVQGLASLDIGLQNFKDGEFSTALAYHGDPQLEELCALYNQTAEKLRREKQWLNQRELMLDKVLHSSPDVLFLVNDQGYVVFSNYQARDFFNRQSALEGMGIDALLAPLPEPLQQALSTQQEGLVTLPQKSGEVQTWHIANGTFLLNNQRHNLTILKQMTRELNRQEVSVWKKVIRVISHELNNSLGPISSLLHSGQIVSKQNGDTRLERVFSTIEERIEHLIQFVQGYGKFAKLPTPNLQPVDVPQLMSQLAEQWTFALSSSAEVSLTADAVQIEQLFINLLKNAHESGSAAEDVAIDIHQSGTNVVIEVLDKGKGMSDTVMANALIPFYSTKSNGSGLGLALCREIADAHHGHLVIQNREHGGLCVRVILPAFSN